jgi:benzoyl-CoA reductase/2-hydroxyglutaryl-CoA dehydratase subunit BcrC/BadD/HgdB
MKDQIQVRIEKEFSEAQAVLDALEDATFRSASLLEAFAALLKLTERSEHPQLSESAVEGLMFIASQEGENLRARLENYTERLRKSRAVAA